MKKRKKSVKKNKLFNIILILVTIIIGLCLSKIDSTYSMEDVNLNDKNTLKVSILDVGQADSILIESNKEYMLIDTGNNNDGKLLVKYFKENNITHFKYVVGTHPHEDHIGGLDDVINNFSIGTLYMPSVITTTKTFTDVMDAMEKNNLRYKVPIIGEKFTLGNSMIEVIYTGNDKKDLNNCSIVLKLVFGDNSFLFMGDATKDVEKSIINRNIKADVLKVGHHGSKYSSSDEFLDRVNPQYAVISVGLDNKYNHPGDSTIDKLNKRNIDIYRTDSSGSIIIDSDGKGISITSIRTNVNGG